VHARASWARSGLGADLARGEHQLTTPGTRTRTCATWGEIDSRSSWGAELATSYTISDVELARSRSRAASGVELPPPPPRAPRAPSPRARRAPRAKGHLQRTVGTDLSAAQHEERLAAVLSAEFDGAARRGLDATVP
jgi:hypothetical protein